MYIKTCYFKPTSMSYAYPTCTYAQFTSIFTKHSLSACLLMHMNSNFMVCVMQSSAFMFQFTYLFICLFCSWFYLNLFISLMPCVLSFFSYALFFHGFNTFQLSSTWSFCNPIKMFYLQ
jgi:hypothetical protein